MSRGHLLPLLSSSPPLLPFSLPSFMLYHTNQDYPHHHYSDNQCSPRSSHIIANINTASRYLAIIFSPLHHFHRHHKFHRLRSSSFEGSFVFSRPSWDGVLDLFEMHWTAAVLLKTLGEETLVPFRGRRESNSNDAIACLRVLRFDGCMCVWWWVRPHVSEHMHIRHRLCVHVGSFGRLSAFKSNFLSSFILSASLLFLGLVEKDDANKICFRHQN